MANIRQVSFSPAYQADLRDVERRRAMAQALTQQSVAPIGTNVVSGHAVPFTAVEGLSKIAQALLAKRGMSKADEQEREIIGKQQADTEAFFGELSAAPTPQEAARLAATKGARYGIDTGDAFKAWIESIRPSTPDRKSLLTVDTDGGTSLRDPFTGQEVALVPKSTAGGKDAFSYQDANDRILVFQNGQKIGEYPKGASPDKTGEPKWLDAGDAWVSFSPDGKEIARVPKGVSADKQADIAARRAETDAANAFTQQRDAWQLERDVKLKQLDHQLNMEKFGAESREARESAAALAQSQKDLEAFRQQGQQALQSNQQAFTASENAKGREADAAKQERQFAFQAGEGALDRKAQAEQSAAQLAMRREELSQRMAELDKQIAATAAQGEAGRAANAQLQQERIAAEAEQKALDRQLTSSQGDLNRAAVRDNQLQQQQAEMTRLQAQIYAAAARGQEDREAQARLQQMRQEHEMLLGEKNREFQAEQAVAERQGRAALQDDQQAFQAGESEADRAFRTGERVAGQEFTSGEREARQTFEERMANQPKLADETFSSDIKVTDDGRAVLIGNRGSIKDLPFKMPVEAKKGETFSTTPVVQRDGSVVLVGNQGTIMPVPLQLPPEEEKNDPGFMAIEAGLRSGTINEAQAQTLRMHRIAELSGSPEGQIVGPDGKPYTDPLYLELKKQVAAASAANVKVENYPQPMPAINPATGQPELVQFGNQGNARPTGFKPAPGADGANKMPAEIQRQRNALITLSKALDDYEKEIKKFNPRSWDQVHPSARAKIEAAHSRVLMLQKEADALGALQQADLAIMERAVTNPGSFKGAFYGQDGLMEQIRMARKNIENVTKTMSDAYGGQSPAPKPSVPSTAPGQRKPLSSFEGGKK